jgi:hypothetical protein
MKKLLILVAAACLFVPAMALAVGNANPTLYLEAYNSAADVEPAGVCGHTLPFSGLIQCYVAKSNPYCYGFIPIHVGKVENGFLGVAYGLQITGPYQAYLGETGCPGFNRGAGGAQVSIYFGSTQGCRQWHEHPGYSKVLANTDLGATYFDIINNADVGHHKVVNCDTEYDEGTVVAANGRAQWGGDQTVTCMGDPTDVELTTWSKIKGLYR